MTPAATRVTVQVQAGITPGIPDPAHTRLWSITARHWETLAPGARMEELAKLAGMATGYATLLMLRPDMVNWVRAEWLNL